MRQPAQECENALIRTDDTTTALCYERLDSLDTFAACLQCVLVDMLVTRWLEEFPIEA
jgi:hypothetical protein